MKYVIFLCISVVLICILCIKYIKIVDKLNRNLTIQNSSEDESNNCRQFVILNSRKEWLYLDSCSGTYMFTCDKEKISIFTLTKKGNVICICDKIVYEMGIDCSNMGLICEKSPNYYFIEEGRKIIAVRISDSSRYVLNEDLSFIEYDGKNEETHISIEHVSMTDSFK